MVEDIYRAEWIGDYIKGTLVLTQVAIVDVYWGR
jgi:hypothetical protein